MQIVIPLKELNLKEVRMYAEVMTTEMRFKINSLMLNKRVPKSNPKRHFTLTYHRG
jgi:hypothetical protein